MPYDEFGRGITREQQEKIDNFRLKHECARNISATLFVILALLFFCVGIVSTIYGLYSMITSGDPSQIVVGIIVAVFIVVSIVMIAYYLR